MRNYHPFDVAAMHPVHSEYLNLTLHIYNHSGCQLFKLLSDLESCRWALYEVRTHKDPLHHAASSRVTAAMFLSAAESSDDFIKSTRMLLLMARLVSTTVVR
jgi:hypothetical protein